MRRGRPALLLLVAAVLAVGGCGGTEVSADEVPGGPPTLTLPPDEAPTSGGGSGDSGDTADEDAATGEDAATPDEPATDTGASVAPSTPGETADTGATTGGTAPTGDAVGAAPETTPAPTSETGGSGGGSEQFEEFCNQNPGAC